MEALAERRLRRKAELERELERILGILKTLPVEKVILFGSLARGEVYEGSDLDLLIVMPSEKSFVDRAVELAQILGPRLGVDLVVYTPEEFKRLQEEGRSFLLELLREGKVLL